MTHFLKCQWGDDRSWLLIKSTAALPKRTIPGLQDVEAIDPPASHSSNCTAGRFTFADRSDKQKEQRMLGSEHVDRQAAPPKDTQKSSKLKPKHIVVAWYEDKVGDLLNSLAAFAPEGSTVTVVCREKPEVIPLTWLLIDRLSFSQGQGLLRA